MLASNGSVASQAGGKGILWDGTSGVGVNPYGLLFSGASFTLISGFYCFYARTTGPFQSKSASIIIEPLSIKGGSLKITCRYIGVSTLCSIKYTDNTIENFGLPSTFQEISRTLNASKTLKELIVYAESDDFSSWYGAIAKIEHTA